MNTSQEKHESASSTRWWEFYAVRYGMSAVIGGAIRLSLRHALNGPLCVLLPGLQEELMALESSQWDGRGQHAHIPRTPTAGAQPSSLPGHSSP